MSAIFDKLLETPPSERVVESAGGEVLVRGMKTSERLKLQTQSTSSRGKIDNAKFQSLLLSACCLDPETEDPIEPDWREWDKIDSGVAAPLVVAVAEVIGLDDDETKALISAKKLDTTES